jgi:hypothetical protein
VTWKTTDITVENTRFINSPNGNQKTGIQISKDAERINSTGNTFEGTNTEIKKLAE